MKCLLDNSHCVIDLVLKEEPKLFLQDYLTWDLLDHIRYNFGDDLINDFIA